jgi:hypothetical protein
MKPDDVNISDLCLNSKLFNDFVYTPLNQIRSELDVNCSNTKISDYIKRELPIGPPEFLNGKKFAFLSRDLATPNYETLRFLSAVDVLGDLTPLFWEYYMDKFTPNVNIYKYSLGKLTFYKGLSNNGNENLSRISVVDFNIYNGKRISEINTLWGQSLIDFHHELIEHTQLKIFTKEVKFFDASSWYLKSGNADVSVYYKHIMILFLTHGILFDDFLLHDPGELPFIKEVFLPAFIAIYKETGRKPLIVKLDPTDMEGKNFWFYYHYDYIKFIKSKLI